MNTDADSNHSYKGDYALLELDDRADWKTAQASYRRLVHLWHPDKFEGRPRERAHAQQQFIALTKSFNVLRSYQRDKSRLPYEPIPIRTNQEDIPPQVSSKKDPFAEITSDDAPLGNTKLTGDSRLGAMKRKRAGKRQTSHIWAVFGAGVMLATVAFFLVLDRKANQANLQKGREVVKQAAPSDFMPSASEIRKSQTRGAFVTPPK